MKEMHSKKQLICPLKRFENIFTIYKSASVKNNPNNPMTAMSSHVNERIEERKKIKEKIKNKTLSTNQS